MFRRGLRGALVALGTFVAVGTVTAVWANPFFVRMTPVGAWELAATAMLAAISGATVAFWVPHCRLGGTSGGGLAGFFGIACPTCNKVLMLIFGGPALMAWFDPLRPYLTIVGLCAMTFAAHQTWKNFRLARAETTRES